MADGSGLQLFFEHATPNFVVGQALGLVKGFCTVWSREYLAYDLVHVDYSYTYGIHVRVN